MNYLGYPKRNRAPIRAGMRTMLSPADRCAACVVALVALLLCAGVRYVFHPPANVGTLSAISAERPHMP